MSARGDVHSETEYVRAADIYLDRQARRLHPSGIFINNERNEVVSWQPDSTEVASCCARVPAPTPQNPYTVNRHCRTIRHLATLFHLNQARLEQTIATRRLRNRLHEQLRGGVTPSAVAAETSDLEDVVARNRLDNLQGFAVIDVMNVTRNAVGERREMHCRYVGTNPTAEFSGMPEWTQRLGNPPTIYLSLFDNTRFMPYVWYGFRGVDMFRYDAVAHAWIHDSVVVVNNRNRRINALAQEEITFDLSLYVPLPATPRMVMSGNTAYWAGASVDELRYGETATAPEIELSLCQEDIAGKSELYVRLLKQLQRFNEHMVIEKAKRFTDAYKPMLSAEEQQALDVKFDQLKVRWR